MDIVNCDELDRYASRKSLLAIELLNEPSKEVQIDTLKKYYQAGYTAVRNQVKRQDVYVIMEGRLADKGDSEMADFVSQFQNCVLDVHFYNLYAPMFSGTMSAEQNINYVTTTRANHLNSEEPDEGRWRTCLCWGMDRKMERNRSIA